MRLLLVLLVLLPVAGGVAVEDTRENGAPDPTADLSPGRDYRDLLSSTLWPFYACAEWFLEDLVQRSYLQDLEERLGREFTDWMDMWETWEEHWEDWLAYLIGYTVCASVGVALILTMSITGGVVACCRCCGNCGGKRPTEGPPSKCVSIGCGISLLVVSGGLIFGIVGIVGTNDVLKDRLKGSDSMFTELGASLVKLDSYLDETVNEINDTTLNQFTEAKDQWIDTLKDIPDNALSALDQETNVVINMKVLKEFSFNLPILQQDLTIVQKLIKEVEDNITDIEADLQDVISEIDKKIDKCVSFNCNNTRENLSALVIGVNASTINFDDAQAAVDTAIDDGIIENVNISSQELDVINNHIDEEINSSIIDIEKAADDVRKEISKFVDDLDTTISDIDIDQAADDISDIDIDFAVTVFYWSVVVLVIILCVTVLCNLMGVLLGWACSRPYPGPSPACEADSSRGSDWLLAGIGFTFLFYWLYTCVVMALFVGGGAAHTEFCRHAIHYDNPKSAEVLDIYDRIFNGSLHDSLGVDLEVFKLYKDCKDDIPFYEALHLDSRGYNISEIIDLSRIENALAEIKDIDIELPNLYLMNDSLKTDLEQLNTALQAIDFNSTYEELQNELISDDLILLAAIVLDLENEEGVNETLNEESAKLTDISARLDRIAGDITFLLHVLEFTEESIIDLDTLASDIDSAEDAINSQGDDIVKQLLNDTADDLLFQALALAEDIEDDVTTDVGKCLPVYDAFTDAIDTTCVETLYPINGFWFSLGWILFFLIPSIILSFQLVTEFRTPVSFDFDPTQAADVGYDAYHGRAEQWTIGGQSADYLLEKMDRQQGMNEFDNPVYMDGAASDFKIPRPSLVENEDADNFRIPRPQLYTNNTEGASTSDNRDSPPPSYHATVIQVGGEDTRL